jgi:hypothetical protein
MFGRKQKTTRKYIKTISNQKQKSKFTRNADFFSKETFKKIANACVVLSSP